MSLLEPQQIAELARGLHDDWTVVGHHHLERTFPFVDFAAALAFTNRVGALAAEQNHHPDVYLAWGIVRLMLWSHDAGGLTTRDFRLAQAIDALPTQHAD